jgi:hypothetical protein
LGSLRPIEYVWHEGIMTNGTLVRHWKTCELRASELWGESSWWWRHFHQCCEGSRGAILGTMATRPGTCRGGGFRLRSGYGGTSRVLGFRRRANRYGATMANCHWVVAPGRFGLHFFRGDG